MYDNLLYAVVSTINDNTKFKCSQVGDEIYQEFEKLDLETGVKRLFQWRWFSQDANVGRRFILPKTF